MPSVIKKIKETFTPSIARTVSQHHHWLMIIGVAFVFITLGFALAFVVLYDRILLLEAAVSVLATR